MKLYTSDSNQFEVLIYQQDGNARGIVGIQEEKDFIIIRYLSLLIRRCVMKNKAVGNE